MYTEECGYNKKFKYNIPLYADGVPGPWIDWCKNNIHNEWGWWFDDKREGHMSFSTSNDATYWALKWSGMIRPSQRIKND